MKDKKFTQDELVFIKTLLEDFSLKIDSLIKDDTLNDIEDISTKGNLDIILKILESSFVNKDATCEAAPFINEVMNKIKDINK